MNREINIGKTGLLLAAAAGVLGLAFLFAFRRAPREEPGTEHSGGSAPAAVSARPGTPPAPLRPREESVDDGNFDDKLRQALAETRLDQKILRLARLAAAAGPDRVVHILDAAGAGQIRARIIEAMLPLIAPTDLAAFVPALENSGYKEDAQALRTWLWTDVEDSKPGKYTPEVLLAAARAAKEGGPLREAIARLAGVSLQTLPPEKLPPLPEDGLAASLLWGYARARCLVTVEASVSVEDVSRLARAHPEAVTAILEGAFSVLFGYSGKEDGKDLSAALVKSLPEESRPTGFEMFAKWLARNDSLKASGWVNELPPGEEKDRAIAGMLEGLREPERETAAGPWIEAVRDPALKQTLAEKYLRQE